MIYVLYSIVCLICVYTARHYWFTLNRLFGFQRHPYIDIDAADWPPVTILVAAHNEEKVIANILQALMTVHYPADKMLIVPVNDRSRMEPEKLLMTSWRGSREDSSFPSHRGQAWEGRSPKGCHGIGGD